MKKFLSILLAACLTLSMTACGGSTPAPSPASPVSPASPESSAAPAAPAVPTEPITIKFANYAILESGYTSFWEGVKKGFEEKYPNITVEYVTAPYGEIVNQVINMAGGGDKVDLIFGEIGWIPTLEDAGLTVPVTDVLSAEFLSDFYPQQLEACSIGGKPYALPMYVSPFMLYYNKDLFKAAGLDPENPPKTYDEMLVAAEALSKLKSADGNKVYGFGQTTASVAVSGSALTSMVYNFGGEVLDKDGKLHTNTPEFKAAFEMLKTLDEKGYNPQNAKLKDLRNLFALGQLGMYYDQSWGFNGVSAINPEAKNFTASAAPLAGGSGKGNSILQAHILAFMDNGDKQKQAVSLFTEYLVSEAVLADYIVNTTPAYPARKSMAGMTAIQNSAVLKGATNSVESTVASPFIPALGQLNLELCTLAQSVTVGKKSFDEAYTVFEKAASALIG
ncbi:MAG: extracellular solute-binding protein [Angelakisella sp.]